jgi:hypothetical protein
LRKFTLPSARGWIAVEVPIVKSSVSAQDLAAAERAIQKKVDREGKTRMKPERAPPTTCPAGPWVVFLDADGECLTVPKY